MASSNLIFRIIGEDDASAAFLKTAAAAKTAQASMSEMGTSTLGLTKLIGGGGLIPIAAAAAAQLTSLSVAAAGAAGAGGILGLAIFGQVKNMIKAHQTIVQLDTKLSKLTVGTKAYKTTLSQLHDAQHAFNTTFGPAAQGVDHMSTAWHKFLDSTRSTSLGVIGKALNIVAGILPRLAPIANAAGRAVGGMLTEFGKWTKGKQFQAILHWLGTSGVTDLKAFVHIAVNLVQGLGGILANFVGPGDKAAASLQRLTKRFAEWGKSKGVSDSVNRFLQYVGANGGKISAVLAALAASLPKLASAAGQLGSINLTITSKALQLIAGLPQGAFNAIADGIFGIAVAAKALSIISGIASLVGVATAALADLSAMCIGTRIGLIGLAIQEKLVAVGAKILAAAQWLLNAAMDANPIGLVVLALAALAAGFVYAYKHSATFRRIVRDALHGVEAAARAVGGFFAHTMPHFFASAWNAITGGVTAFARGFIRAISAAISGVIGIARAHWPLIVGVFLGPVGLLTAEIIHHWSAVVAGARTMVSNVASAVGRIGGAIAGAVGRAAAAASSIAGAVIKAVSVLPGDMIDIGINIVMGIVHGIESVIGQITSAAQSIVSHISGKVAKLLGIASPSKVMRQIGVFTMQGLVLGLKDGMHTVSQTMSALHSLIGNWTSKLGTAIGNRNAFAAGFSQFSTSVFGGNYGTDANGNPIAPNVTQILAFQQNQERHARNLRNQVHRLIKMGLSKSLIQQLQAAGPQGLAEIAALSNATPAQIRALNQANAGTARYDHQAGMDAGNAIYGKQIAHDQRELRLAKMIAREFAHEIPKHLGKGETIVVEIDGQNIVTAVRKNQRKRGVPPSKHLP